MEKYLFDFTGDIRIAFSQLVAAGQFSTQLRILFFYYQIEYKGRPEIKNQLQDQPPDIAVIQERYGADLGHSSQEQYRPITICYFILFLVCGQYDLFIGDEITQQRTHQQHTESTVRIPCRELGFGENPGEKAHQQNSPAAYHKSDAAIKPPLQRNYITDLFPVFSSKRLIE